MKSEKAIKIGILTYSHPLIYPTTQEREEYVRNNYLKLYNFLSEEGFDAVAPLEELRKNTDFIRYGISEVNDTEYCLKYLKSNGVDVLIIQLNQWTKISLVTSLIKELNVPTAIYANSDGDYPGEVTASAVAASLLEDPYSRNCLLIERFRDSENDLFLKWVKAVVALKTMQFSRVLILGGNYGADIPYTRDDETTIENVFVKEIIPEQEMVIIEMAKKILENEKPRVINFLKWLNLNNLKIKYDGKMLNENILYFQIAQYLAVKDRMKELKDENIKGLTIKCHFEVSTSCIGCTECLIPAFLPYSIDNEGKKEIYPVGCEGDLKGLLTNMMMLFIKPEIPPLFGDVITFQKNYVMISNCGSASVYWAARSTNPRITLPMVKLLPQIHGKSGAAVNFFTIEKENNIVTYARLFRLKRKYYMYLGVGDITQVGGSHNRIWPVTKVYFKTDPYLLFKTNPANHGSITEGDISKEIEYFCRYAGIEVVRFDNDKSILEFINKIAYI